MEFLTMMGEHLFEFDTEAELIEAFESFDESDTGFVKCDEIRRWLSEVGERMDQEEVPLIFCFLCAVLNDPVWAHLERLSPYYIPTDLTN